MSIVKSIHRTILFILILFFAMLSIVTPVMAEGGYNWTEQTNPGSRNYAPIAASPDGKKIVAAVGYGAAGYIYTSTDFGATWTERTGAGSHVWNYVATSSDGNKLVAVVGPNEGGYIYTSTDSGATWTERTSAGSRAWTSVASSSDGTKLVATVLSGYIYTSTDSGATWTERTSAGSRAWYVITSSSDGNKLAVNVHGGYLYTSTDSGATWTEQTAAGSRTWFGIDSNDNGTKIVATVLGGNIYTSTDSGATWNEKASAGVGWGMPSLSADGSKIAVAKTFAPFGNDYIYTSTDSGNTWIEQTSAGSRGWGSIVLSDDGSRLAAVVYGGYIYTAYNPNLVETPTPTTFPNATNSAAVSLSVPTGTTLISSSAVSPTSIANDANMSYPLGLVDFSMTVSTGSTQTIELTFVTDLTPSEVTARKYDTTTEEFTDVPGATITHTTLDSKPALLLTYQITDGGLLDQDNTANGTIVDPVGLATVSSTTTLQGDLADTGINSVLINLLATTILIASLVTIRRYNTTK
ncbi:hypothetical protein KC946_00660 [Candidatus Saccharibacteria bacterium]|nr:hypothetical protein [Candidatus Saccharibacteria bacterium]